VDFQRPREFEDFSIAVQKSIDLLASCGGSDGECVEHLVRAGINREHAVEIVLFLPIAFCRRFLPKVNWPSEYIEHVQQNNPIAKRYADNHLYRIIEEETNFYWQNPQKSIVLNVAGRSAEFHAINNLLLEGGKLEDIRLTEVHIIK